MKTHFTSREIAHVWANQSAPRGKSPSNLSFEGLTVYSYSTEMGLILKPGHAVLINRTSYSNSTSKAQGRIASAVSHYPVVFNVRGLSRGAVLCNLTGRKLFAHYLGEAHKAIAEAAKPRIRANTRAALFNQAQGFADDANRANDFFKLRRKPVTLNLESELAKVSADLAAKAEKDAKAAAKHAAACAVFAPRVLSLWREHGEKSEAWNTLRDEISAAGLRSVNMADFLVNERGFNPDAALRLSVDGSRVETSRGAQVLVRTVRFLWEFCATARATRKAVAADLVARFPVLDNYRLDSIDARGNIVAGCHRIPFSEVETIARALNLPPFNGEPMGAATVPSAASVAA